MRAGALYCMVNIMVDILSIQSLGSQLMVNMSDGSKRLGYRSSMGLWLVANSGVTPEPGDGSIYNPWGPLRPGEVDGWESHQSYSWGGNDWSWGTGVITSLLAPAAGILHTSGGSGEFAAGNQGSAGLRSVLYLDSAVNRVSPKSTTVMAGGRVEADGPMVAIVLQHQSSMGVDRKHYGKGEACGNSGNTDGTSSGGDWHVHVHGLDAEGRRVDFIKFVI